MHWYLSISKQIQNVYIFSAGCKLILSEVCRMASLWDRVGVLHWRFLFGSVTHLNFQQQLELVIFENLQEKVQQLFSNMTFLLKYWGKKVLMLYTRTESPLDGEGVCAACTAPWWWEPAAETLMAAAGAGVTAGRGSGATLMCRHLSVATVCSIICWPDLSLAWSAGYWI